MANSLIPGSPTTKLGRTSGINAITDRNNHVQIIKIARFSRKFGISEFSQCCGLIQFSIIVDIFYMLIDCRGRFTEQLCNQFLSQPDSLILNSNFNTVVASLRGKNQTTAVELRISFFIVYYYKVSRNRIQLHHKTKPQGGFGRLRFGRG